jgi:hypothetical protein
MCLSVLLFPIRQFLRIDSLLYKAIKVKINSQGRMLRGYQFFLYTFSSVPLLPVEALTGEFPVNLGNFPKTDSNAFETLLETFPRITRQVLQWVPYKVGSYLYIFLQQHVDVCFI